MLGGLATAGVLGTAAGVCGVSWSLRLRVRPAVTVFGAANTFGELPTRAPAAGPAVVAQPVADWSSSPGHGLFAAAMGGDGSVVLATTPLTDNQLRPTAADMRLLVFTPDAPSLRPVVVPSTRGQTVLTGPAGGGGSASGGAGAGVGGGDVSAVVALPGTSPPRVLFTSFAPWHGWDTATLGQLPTLGELVRSGRGWTYDASRSRTADQLAAATPADLRDSTFPPRVPGPRDSRGVADAVVLPHSGHVIAAQYLAARAPGGAVSTSGGLFAYDPVSGEVLAAWTSPPIAVFGQTISCAPRQLAADPSSTAEDERFVVVYDTADPAGEPVPFPIQEFSYSSSARRIVPVSTALRAAQDGTRMELARFTSDGTLVVARTKADGWAAATVAVYRKTDGRRRLTDFGPGPAAGQAPDWGTTCPPDEFVAGTDTGGLVRSMDVDPATGRVFVTGLGGIVQTLRTGADVPVRRLGDPLDLRIDRLRGPEHYPIGMRQGAVDLRRRLLWLPCNQLTLDRLPYPIPPVAVDQWLYRIDLEQLPA